MTVTPVEEEAPILLETSSKFRVKFSSKSEVPSPTPRKVIAPSPSVSRLTPAVSMVRAAKVGLDAVVRFCPVLNASSVSVIESAMTLKVAVSVAEVTALMVPESDNVTVSPVEMV